MLAIIVGIVVIAIVAYGIKRHGGVTKTKTLTSGELIIKTYDGQYYHAVDNNSVPVLINKEEGKRLWSLEGEEE